MTEKKQIDDVKLKQQLTDTQFQKGLSWRKDKVHAVAKARKEGYSERAIFAELKRAGLTNHTANAIMDDAYYCDGTEDNESFMDYAKRREKEKKEK